MSQTVTATRRPRRSLREYLQLLALSLRMVSGRRYWIQKATRPTTFSVNSVSKIPRQTTERPFSSWLAVSWADGFTERGLPRKRMRLSGSESDSRGRFDFEQGR